MLVAVCMGTFTTVDTFEYVVLPYANQTSPATGVLYNSSQWGRSQPLDTPACPAQDLVHRLEGVLMQWTRSVREVAARQDAGYGAMSTGPLAELAFWRARSIDLFGIRDQLDGPGTF